MAIAKNNGNTAHSMITNLTNSTATFGRGQFESSMTTNEYIYYSVLGI